VKDDRRFLNSARSEGDKDSIQGLPAKRMALTIVKHQFLPL
jgi:hypothetical protein